MTVFMNVVVLLAVLLLASRTALGQAPETCSSTTNGRHYCQDCKTGVRCGSSGPPQLYVTCTRPGEACAVVGNTATCVPQEDSPCRCDWVQQCDAYDSDALFVCLNGDTNLLVSKCPYQQTCINNVCDYFYDELCHDATWNGYVVIKPECTSAVYCNADSGASSGTFYCPAGQYFDPKLGCDDSPPLPCEGDCYDGACPDKTDCSRYYVCYGSVNDTDTQYCDNPAMPYYDPATETCQEDKTRCTPTAGCDFS